MEKVSEKFAFSQNIWC